MGSSSTSLKNIEDATDIRRRILLAFEEAENIAHAEDRAPMLTFVVVGGGPTGVELAGAIAELARKALVADFRKIQSHHARVLLIEAGPRLLPAFPERLSAAAERALERLGAEGSRRRCGMRSPEPDSRGRRCKQRQ